MSFPKPRGTIEQIYDRITGRGEDGDGTTQTAAGRIVSRLAGVLATVDGMLADQGILRMPVIGEIR